MKIRRTFLRTTHQRLMPISRIRPNLGQRKCNFGILHNIIKLRTSNHLQRSLIDRMNLNNNTSYRRNLSWRQRPISTNPARLKTKRRNSRRISALRTIRINIVHLKGPRNTTSLILRFSARATQTRINRHFNRNRRMLNIPRHIIRDLG